jgi:hypothetical protein
MEDGIMTTKPFLSSSTEEIAEATSVHGLVHEFDQRAKTFQITRVDGSLICDLPVEAQHYDTLLEASNGFRDKLHVRVFGVGLFDRNNRLQKMEEVDSVIILDPLDVWVRIDELKLLREGWLNGKGHAPKHDGLDWLAQWFQKYFVGDEPFPHLFPTPEGNVLAEWDCKPWSPSLEIDLSTKKAEWHLLNVESDREEERIIDLRLPEDCLWLTERIGSLESENK